MIRYLAGLAFLAAVAGAGSYLVSLYALPHVIMGAAERRLAEAAGGYNRTLHGRRPTAETRGVVRPSPDQLYTVCVFDLEAGPVRFTGRVPDSYFSLSMYAGNTDTFFVVNDRELEADYGFVLVGPQAEPPDDAPESAVVRAPTRTGIAVTRLFIPGPEALPALKRVQRSAACEAAGDDHI